MTHELVSIVTPSYNTADFIAETIKSVQDQTYTNWEMIIVDDCSTDRTDEIVAEFVAEDPRIRYMKNEKNCGAAQTRNRALREARGRWIAFLDSDDLWLPTKLERQVSFMEANGYSFSYTQYSEITESGQDSGVCVSGPGKITRAGMFAFCWPGCLTVMYDAAVVGLIQIADIKKNNDYAMWLKICRGADCYLLSERLAKYRRARTGSISTQSLLTMIQWHYKLFREAEKMSLMCSVWRTGVNLACGLYKKKRYVKRVH